MDVRVVGQRLIRDAPGVEDFVEQVFRVPGILDIDPAFAGEQVVIRREIISGGKSRSFINDSPVNLSQLKTIAAYLVDLHQQFDTLALSKDGFQLEIIDAIAGNGERLSDFQKTFDQYASVLKKLTEARTAQANARKEFDYVQFQLDELEQLALKENELEELDAELKLLSNSESE
jgi:DNA repair protein RecN (Recombination protein N)